jgi:hypothetical protein
MSVVVGWTRDTLKSIIKSGITGPDNIVYAWRPDHCKFGATFVMITYQLKACLIGSILHLKSESKLGQPKSINLQLGVEPQSFLPVMVSTSRTEYLILAGLHNLGNTCYMNAALQIMLNWYSDSFYL